MRGKVETLYTELSRVGITPAYAGKSSFSLILSICGSGSPPPMRGKAIAAFPRHHASRITPAYAGKSSQRICERIETKDHPRLCGEKFADNRYIYIEIGSPPPMRGKAFDPSLIILNKRITPAYAGKREFRRVQTLLHQDHPRLCGEKGGFRHLASLDLGSPPPMRGKD